MARKKKDPQEQLAQHALEAQQMKALEEMQREVEKEFERQILMPFSQVFRVPNFFSMPDEMMVRPSVDAAKLEALKTAEPHKVQPCIPDYFQVLTGWRAWRVSMNDGEMRLQAIGQSTFWQPKKQIEAVCVGDNRLFSAGSVFGIAGKSSPAHRAPHPDCECGIWAFKELDSLVAALGTKYAQVAVLGQVSLWGKVIETENGYRAEKAYPSELWLFDSELEELGLIYDVPVRLAK